MTRWSLATELNRHLGQSFAGNWSYRGAIKDELDRHTEGVHCYAHRVIKAILETPEILERYKSLAECMGSFGLANYMRRNPEKARQIRTKFTDVHAQSGVGG